MRRNALCCLKQDGSKLHDFQEAFNCHVSTLTPPRPGLLLFMLTKFLEMGEYLNRFGIVGCIKKPDMCSKLASLRASRWVSFAKEVPGPRIFGREKTPHMFRMRMSHVCALTLSYRQLTHTS